MATKRAAADPQWAINRQYTASSFVDACKHALTHTAANSNVDGTSAEVIVDPFRTAAIPDFLVEKNGENSLDLAGLMEELRDQTWNKKNNDLYYFYQTDDLKGCRSTEIVALCRFLCSDVLEWMQRVTGFALNKHKVDIFAGRYTDTGTLLCHDDQLDGRRVAFILYLSPNWQTEYGGALELFSTDDAGKPKEVVRRIMPQFNTFAFFEVSETSFHQVGEVTAAGQERWSITGWYHDEKPQKRQQHIQGKTPFNGRLPLVDHTHTLQDWINPRYLSDSVKCDIRDRFLEQSSLQLQSFLTTEKCESLMKTMQDVCGDALDRRGSPLHNRYASVLPRSSAEWDALQSFIASDVFLNYVREITCLDLTGGETELQRFGHGDYTLLYDGDPTHGREALDVMLCVLPTNEPWDMADGGVITYIAGTDELLSVTPVSNALSLVFRDADTMGFVKYINNHAGDKAFIRCYGVFIE